MSSNIMTWPELMVLKGKIVTWVKVQKVFYIFFKNICDDFYA